MVSRSAGLLQKTKYRQVRLLLIQRFSFYGNGTADLPFTVMQWCNANGINVRRYYYWFKVVHSDLEETDQPELVEVKEVKEDSRPAAEAVIHIADGRIELSDSISGSLLHRIISELRHA